MTTAVDLMTLALKDMGALGIGQSIGPDDTADGLATLNMMLGQWQVDRLTVYHLVDVVKQSTGAQSYTVGIGGDFSTSAWQPSIESAFMRLGAVDYPLKPIIAREDYNKIALKSLASMSEFYFYDSAYPMGNIFFYPVPNNSFELHISVLEALPQFSTPSTVVTLPQPYMAAIRYNLALWLCPTYQIEPTPQLQKLAAHSLRVIKRMNAQIPSLSMPRGLGTKSKYNIYSDRKY